MRFIVDIHYQTKRAITFLYQEATPELKRIMKDWASHPRAQKEATDWRMTPHGAQMVFRYQANNTANDHGSERYFDMD